MQSAEYSLLWWFTISDLDFNVYRSAPELKQSSRTWRQKEAKFLVFGLWGTASQPNFFSTVMSIYLGIFRPRLLFLNGLKKGLKLKISKPINASRLKNIIFFDDTPHFRILKAKIFQCVRSWRLWVRQCLICLYGRTATAADEGVRPKTSRKPIVFISK